MPAANYLLITALTIALMSIKTYKIKVALCVWTNAQRSLIILYEFSRCSCSKQLQRNILSLMTIASWYHSFPFRTGQWNDLAPMIVRIPVWK